MAPQALLAHRWCETGSGDGDEERARGERERSMRSECGYVAMRSALEWRWWCVVGESP